MQNLTGSGKIIACLTAVGLEYIVVVLLVVR